MSKILTALKAKAAPALATVQADVRGYVRELEAAIAAHRNWLIGVGIVCLVIGAFIGHALPHH